MCGIISHTLKYIREGMTMRLDIDIPSNVATVIRRLKRYGYQAYLVGGCVRDTLIGKVPKDWDIATDATPEEVSDVFDNSRVVGKRFPIAHVCFRGEIIEVVTFRNGEEGYGTMIDDVYRRDYTVNALYWDEGEVIDPFTGLDDIMSREVVCIGKPDARFAEDPVRMLRAARLVQLGFELTPDVDQGIARNLALMKTVNKSRLFCEFNKAFAMSDPIRVLSTLHHLKLMQGFFPRAMYEHPDEPDLSSVQAVICCHIWTYYCDLVGSCMIDFGLHPIPASQKAAKLAVDKLRAHMDVDRNVALKLKLLLADRYRTECT